MDRRYVHGYWTANSHDKQWHIRRTFAWITSIVVFLWPSSTYTVECSACACCSDVRSWCDKHWVCWSAFFAGGKTLRRRKITCIVIAHCVNVKPRTRSVLAKFRYGGPTRLCRRLFQKNPSGKPNLWKGGRRERNCCRFFNYTSMQLRGCEFITEEGMTTLRVGEKVHPWDRTVRRM